MIGLSVTKTSSRASLWWAAVLISLATILTPTPAQTRDQGRAEFHETYDLNPGGTVSVGNVSGYIRVTSWDENRVRVDAVKRARRSEDLSLVEIQVNARPDRVEIRTSYPRFRSSNVSVDYDVKVPRSAVINSLNSTSGEITVIGPVARLSARSTSGGVTAQNIHGDANLSTTSGQIAAERVDGALTIITTSGELQISDVSAQLNARSTSGSIRAFRVKDDAIVNSTSGSVRLERTGGRVISRTISGAVYVNDVAGDVHAGSVSEAVTVENVRGRVTASSTSGRVLVRNAQDGARAETVSGSIEIVSTRGRIEADATSGDIILREVDSRDLQVKSFSGSVRFQGKLYDNGRYEFGSFSGEVVLLLPADSGFTLRARTNSGEIETDFPLRLLPGDLGRRPRSLQGTYGDGGAQISATGYSGSIRIRKR
jgi:DUF4097 and DUF4098 domain-containing protein YvlB